MEHGVTPSQSIWQKVIGRIKSRFPKIVEPPFEEAKLIENMSFAEYLDDCSRMNSSGLKHLLRTPAHYIAYMDKSQKDDKEDKEELRIGKATHTLVFEPDVFKQNFVIKPEFIGYTKDGKPTTSRNSKDVKEQEEKWLSDQKPGALILSEEDFDRVVGMAEALAAHPKAGKMIYAGKHETTIHWTDKDTGVMCKARPDCISTDADGNIHLVDLKTTKDSRAGLFADDVGRLRYFVQMAFYHDAITKALGKQPLTITLIAVERDFPHAVSVFPLADDWFEEGQKEYKKALMSYKEGIKTGLWKAYNDEAELLHMPAKYRQFN